MDGIREWIAAEGTGHVFFIAFPFLLCGLFICLKGRRIRFLVPALLMTLAILNPIFYRVWTDLGLYAYWRILWVVPVIPVLAAIVPCLTERIRNPWLKTLAILAGVGCAFLGGTFLYGSLAGSFVKATNTAKVPEMAVQAADKLLRLDPHPRAVLQYPLGTYVRQYTGEIVQPYGRDIDGYILYASGTAREIHKNLSEGNLEAVATAMADNDYLYLVTDQPAEAEFELLDQAGNVGIYRAHGTPTVVKDRNELGQVIRTTTVDADKCPVNGSAGYATVEWQYDGNGNITREFRTDTEGKGVADSQGRAGYEREFDSHSRIVMERMLDPEGHTLPNSLGYAEIRREYKGSVLIRESYYDAAGKPVNRIDTRYAVTQMAYDRDKNRISETYLDADGNAVCSSAGYASVRRRYEQHRLTEEKYYDETGAPVCIAAGFGRTLAYDAAGNLTTETSIDAGGLPFNNINGYAVKLREFDKEKNIVLERFLDADGNLVIPGAGYAEVHRTYDGKHLIQEEYIGADGKPMIQLAGYAGIRQTWDGDTLLSREYLDVSGNPVDRRDGYAKVVWDFANCRNVKFYALDGTEIPNTGLNLADGIRSGADGWSDWRIPNYNAVNSCQNLGYVNLGPKTEGDVYTSTVEIEFRNVRATEGQTLRFWTQGAQDGRWTTGNVWNAELVNLSEPPKDGIYTFTSTVTVSGPMVDISSFDVGFRCDYWADGQYRVRSLKIEKGNTASEWSPGL